MSDGPAPLELTQDGTRFHVVGTAHVSARSVAEVGEVIRRVRPEVVCVELCQARFEALTQDKSFRDLDVFKVVREGRTLYLLAHLALTAYQRRMGAALGVRPGAELLAAITAAEEVGARVALVDRDVNVTLKRTWANVGLWKRSQLLASVVVGFGDDGAAPDPRRPGKAAGDPLTADDIEAMKEQHTLSEMLAELSRAMPEIKGPLIDERDLYLADGIRAEGAGAREVVAVVGAAHVPGIRQHFGSAIDRAVLDRLPPPSRVWTAVKWLLPALFLAALVYFWRRSDQASLTEMMLAWIVPTGVGAALLTALGGGHVLSVLTALVVAPIAAIHPLLGTGMVVGVVEAWRRRPGVRDCEQLPEDIQTFRGFRRNPVTRILLIAVLSGLGTAVGFWVGVAWVATLI
ncbi:MAG: TraB/GumN family protein [Kofleriaceae bacterium]